MSKQEEEEFEVPVCDYIHANPELVASLKEQTPDDGLLVRLLNFLRFSETPQGSKSFMCSWSTKCASVTSPFSWA